MEIIFDFSKININNAVDKFTIQTSITIINIKSMLKSKRAIH